MERGSRRIATNLQLAALRKTHQFQMGLAWPDRVAQQDISLHPDAGDIMETDRKIRHARPGGQAIHRAHSQVDPQREHNGSHAQAAETLPREYFADMQL